MMLNDKQEFWIEENMESIMLLKMVSKNLENRRCGTLNLITVSVLGCFPE